MGPMGRSWAIAPHDAPAPWGQTIDDALQAGPQLLPTLDLAGEAFVLQDAQGRITRDGIGALGRAARSAIGLLPDGAMLFVATSGVTRKGTGLTIAQLAGLLKRLGATEALALDGGSSTTLSWTEAGRLKTFVGGGAGPALVNSALVVEPLP
jgi:exopolysaccharide biosynthesis protein